ncbi:MAG TPA: metal ABC transporter ATPase [Cyanothece sp. UBA12306]|nr:metal ABC transporter ATPase [Cyanothece sp. UBA12306]
MVGHVLGSMEQHQAYGQKIGQQIEATEEQLGNYLKQHNEIEMVVPVLIGVFVTSRFQLRGANALLVNLAVASVCRQLFTTIKDQASQTENTVIATAAMNSNNKSNNDSDSEYTIVHSVPGRIRIKVPKITEDQDFAKRLQQLLNQDNCVTKVRINRSAASVIINYDGEGLSDIELGLRLLSIFNNAQENQVSAGVS